VNYLSNDMEALQNRLKEAMVLIKQAIDLSAQIKLENPSAWKQVTGIWEVFLGEFWQYIKVQSAKSGQNLLRGISLLSFRP
jgi:hypothetical protein